MSSSEQANAFYRDVIASGEVFLVEHETRGSVTWRLAGSQHARPVWSSRRRAVRMLEGPLAKPGLVIVRHSWDEFRDSIAPAIEREGILVGLNWAGRKARGYNIPPSDVVARIEAARHTQQRPKPGPPEHETDAGDTRRAG